MTDKGISRAGTRKAGAIMVLVAVFFGAAAAAGVFAQTTTAENEEPRTSAAQAEVQKFGMIAAALAFGLGAIGAGIAIANVGSAAMGAIGEKPEIAGQALIFIALAEGLVVFGFITALMILGKF